MHLPPSLADHPVQQRVEAVVGTGERVEKFLYSEVRLAGALLVNKVPSKGCY